MASPFKSTGAANVGTGVVTIGTVPASKVWTIIDLSCANVEPGNTEVKGTVRHIKGANTYHLIKDGPIPKGGAMVVVGAPRKVSLAAGESITALCDKATGMDVTLSYLEQDA